MRAARQIECWYVRKLCPWPACGNEQCPKNDNGAGYNLDYKQFENGCTYKELSLV